MHEHLYEDFNLPGYSEVLRDVSVTIIDKTDPENPEDWFT